MKKILILTLILLFVLSCNNNSYTIRGKSDISELNDVTINIRTFDGENWNTIGNVKVKNQKFIFKGKTEKPSIASLSFDNREKQLRGSKYFILEKGKINFEIDKNSKIITQGTEANDLLQRFENDLENVFPKAFIDSMRNKTLSESQTEERLKYYTEERNKLITGFSGNHVNTLPGTLIFLNFYYEMSVENRIEILNLMNEETKSNSHIQMIKKQTENEKRIAVGEKYMDFKLPDIYGNMISLSDLIKESDYLLIDFWASWCGPCLRSFPELTKFYDDNKGKNFEILGVSLDDKEAAWKTAIEKHNLKWKHVSDLKGWESLAGQLYAVNSIPCTVLINKEGTIIGRNMSLREIEKLIK